MMNDSGEMKIERRHVKSLAQGLVLLIITVLMSVLPVAMFYCERY